jgi:hypothetical protein
MKRVLLAVVACVSLCAGTARALDSALVKDADKPTEPGPVQGWDGEAKIGANFSLGQSQNVVGSVDGVSWTLGANLSGGLYYLHGNHDWRNSLSLVEAFTYGPPLDQFVKTNDRLAFASVYYYHIPHIRWFGPFAKFTLDTSLFESADYRAAPTTYTIDGVAQPKQLTRLKLTDSGLPLVLREVVGLFARPLDRTEFVLEFRVGAGAENVFADGERAVKGYDAPSNTVSVVSLNNFSQVGLDAGLVLRGEIWDHRAAYKAYADAMTPFYRSDIHDTRTNWQSTNVEAGVKLSFRFVKWASLEYEFRVLRVPQMVDVTQITNSLLISFNYDLVQRTPPPAPPAPAPAAAPAK